MTKRALSADTPLSEIAALAAGPRQKLQLMGVETLADIATRLSRSQLKQMRRIGPKTLALIEQLLAEAGLQLAPHRLGGDAEQQARLQQQVQRFEGATEQLKAAVAAWVDQHNPEAVQAWRQHRAGAYGDYLKAQLLALNSLAADAVIKREFEHQLVRSLNRYQKQCRYANSKEALMDGISARGATGSTLRKRRR